MNELNEILKKITYNKNGLEIGGPSPNTGSVIYENVNNMDNINFSNKTVWSDHDEDYNFYENKKGKTIINDAVKLKSIRNSSYDFLFSSHNLEHIANPLKAINEWLRVIKDDGYIILILPEKSQTFDHKRSISPFDILLQQYNNNVGEDDLSSLREILTYHDLSKDENAGSFVDFVKRSLNNNENRCLHHYVYDENLLKQICNYFNCEYIY